LNPGLGHLIDAKRAQYARTNVQDPLSDPHAQRFLFALARASDPLCQPLLSTLYAGNTWVASHFGLVCGKTLHYWFPVYNPQVKAFSPGRLLLKAIINSGGEIGLTRIDRGAGDSIAKRDLATSQHHFQRGVWKRQNIISIGYQVGLSILWRSQRFPSASDKNVAEN
jgi:CelD/BcsL family acetyltransferase involved in cellulose biosynthesis